MQRRSARSGKAATPLNLLHVPHLTAYIGPMQYATDRPFAEPEAAARKLVEIAHAAESYMDGRIPIEIINAPFLKAGGSPCEYGAGLQVAIAKGWLWRHESGVYVKFTPAGAELFARDRLAASFLRPDPPARRPEAGDAQRCRRIDPGPTGGRAEDGAMADRNASAAGGGQRQRRSHARPDRNDAGAVSARREGFRQVAEGPALGQAQAEARSMKEAAN